MLERDMSGGSPGKCTAAVSCKTGYTSLLSTLERVCQKIIKGCSSITSAMILDTSEVHNVNQYARMLEFLCSVLQLCGGFEPDKLLQPQVKCAPCILGFDCSIDAFAVSRAALGAAGGRHALRDFLRV